ncbi:hypothetical protein H4582DRAFT_700243 [Lactarius indigo]|nr:hypothetical protein H4582DRAFT_700243 [Lactarius indigo]
MLYMWLGGAQHLEETKPNKSLQVDDFERFASKNKWILSRRDPPFSPFIVSPDSHPADFIVPSSEEELQISNEGIWSMYNGQAEKHDKQLVERWIGQTRCTLNFAGLFSIVVSAFMVGTDLRKRDSTELLLAQIYLQISGQVNNAVPLPDIRPLRPNSLAIAVQTLWSLSLILSLACALGAILVQGWCQEYLRYSQCHRQPSTRARIRAYLFNGARNYHMEQVITALPLFLHLAILLFCAGLVTYFFTLHKVVAYTALTAYSISGASYLFFTISPLIDTSSPFKTPISTFLWRFHRADSAGHPLRPSMGDVVHPLRIAVLPLSDSLRSSKPGENGIARALYGRSN